jgi:hypothetical protein
LIDAAVYRNPRYERRILTLEYQNAALLKAVNDLFSAYMDLAANLDMEPRALVMEPIAKGIH